MGVPVCSIRSDDSQVFLTSGFGKRSGVKDEEGCLIFYPSSFTIQANLDKSLRGERLEESLGTLRNCRLYDFADLD